MNRYAPTARTAYAAAGGLIGGTLFWFGSCGAAGTPFLAAALIGICGGAVGHWTAETLLFPRPHPTTDR